MRHSQGDRLDAIVVGGGPAGSACAITLAEAGRAVVLVDRGVHRPGRDGDVLPPDVRPALERLGVWERFRAGGGHLASPGMVSVWGEEEAVDKDFIWSPFGAAWHIDRRAFDALLLDAAASAGTDVWRAARATGAVRDGDGWAVDVVREGRARRLGAHFLVEATGRSASITRMAAVRRVAFDRLVGVVATLDRCATDPRLLLESSEDGWWYSAPIPGRRLVVGWMTDPDLTGPVPGGLRRAWPGRLARTSATGSRVHDPGSAKPAVVAANSTCRRAALDHWLAVGDAAAAYDPLSGQGVVRALETGRVAAAAVVATQAGGGDALDAYAGAVAEDFRRYLVRQGAHYAIERRWPAAPFWARRQQGSGQEMATNWPRKFWASGMSRR